MNPISIFANIWKTADWSPPQVPVAPIGVLLTPGSDTLVGGAPGRENIELAHAGNVGRIWIGVGQVAVEGQGMFLDPGDVWERWTHAAIHVLLASTALQQSVVGQEWGA